MRFIMLAASFIVLLCLGGLYAWTAFVPAIKSSYGLSTAETQIIFGGLIAVLTLTMAVVGKVLESRGPRPLLIISGVLFAAGYVTASFSGGEFWVLLLGISGFAGIATGLGYICPLSTCIKWFPDHKGLVSGIAVAGFGGGAIVLTNLAEVLLDRGVSVLMIFRWVGLLYGTAILTAGIIIRFPRESCAKPSCSAPSTSNLYKDPFFWALACAMFCGTFAGLLVIGNLMPMTLAAGVVPSLAAFSISTFAAGNALGRITWGSVVDKMEVKSVRRSLIFLAAALSILIPATSNALVFILGSLLVGFGFGACFVIHAALVATRYGANSVGRVYPLIFSAYGIAGITGPWFGGWLFDLKASYSYSIVVSIAVVVAGLLASEALFSRAERSAVRAL